MSRSHSVSCERPKHGGFASCSCQFREVCVCDVRLSVAFIDVVCPPTTVYMAYNNLRGKKRILNYTLLGHEAPENMKEVFSGIFKEHVQRIQLPEV